jgi:hypothetical protein
MCQLSQFRCLANEAFALIDFELYNLVVRTDMSSELLITYYNLALLTCKKSEALNLIRHEDLNVTV